MATPPRPLPSASRWTAPVFSLKVPFEIVAGVEPGLKVPVKAFPSYLRSADTGFRSAEFGPHSPLHFPEMVSAANNAHAMARHSTRPIDALRNFISLLEGS